MRQVGEPSVEEILESIKKVIARDNRIDAGRVEAAQVRPRRDPTPTPSASPAQPRVVRERGDVLDLTEVAAQIMAGDHAHGEVEVDDEPDFAEADDDNIDAPLLAAATTASMRDSLAALAMLSEPGAQPQIVRSGETSLEGLVREMLRPMLAEWLDKNLPPVVEKMVSTEIARIVGKKS
ncbi:MAG: hypothetical protein B7Z39_01945 [Novosphingobium sp. 12-64-8]|nr:MAG: hypothetical protein B7Z39_01945 [Novosphingobium sp. 12-64-8]